MTDRYTADTITSDALDALYYRLDRARDAAALHRQGLITTAELYAVFETAPESGPAATEATEIGDIQLTRKLGHGLIVETAPPRARMALAVLANTGWGARVQGADCINIGDQVLYQVTGYDPEHAALLLELAEDWRPPVAPAPPKERCDCPPTNAGLELCPDCPGRTKETPMPDKPTCTATITGPHVLGGGPIQCTREPGHPENHVGPKRGDYGRTLWTDHSAGATPHRASSGEQR